MTRGLLLSLILITFSFSSTAQSNKKKRIGNENNWIAIVGDSTMTGSAASPDFKGNLSNAASLYFFTPSAKFEHLSNPMEFGITDVAPPTRVFYSEAEMAEAKRKGEDGELTAAYELSKKVDTPQYSVGYMVGRSKGMNPEDIVIAAKGGSKVETLSEQFDRIAEVKSSSLPPNVLVSFAGNELCEKDVLTEEIDVLSERFGKTLESEWRQVMSRAKPHDRGTRILILAPVSVKVAMSNKKMLAKKVQFDGKTVTCRQLHLGTFEQSIFGSKLLHRVLDSCDTLLKTIPEDSVRIDRLVRVQRAFTQKWKDTISKLSDEYGRKGFRFEYLDTNPQMEASLESEDFANDCFHGSPSGNAKMAKIVLRKLNGEEPAPVRTNIATTAGP